MKTRNENGSVVVVALIILAVLTLFGVAITNIAQVELVCASNHSQHTKAFYHAEAGANVALAVARGLIQPYKNNWGSLPDPITFNNRTYMMDDSLMRFDVTIVPRRDSSGHVVLWGDTNNDAKCEENTTKGYPIIVITSTGYAPGNASAVVQVLARMPVLFSKVPAPLYGADGIDQSGSAQSARADGQYHIGTFDCPDIDSSNTFDAVTMVGTGNYSTAQEFCTVKTCGPPVLPSDSGPKYPVSQNIDNLKPEATSIPTNPPNGSVFGTADNPGIFYCPGNLVTNNLTVYGMLLVEGNVELGGNANLIKGLSLVKGTTLIGGGGKVATYGAWLSEGMVTINGGVEFYYDCRVFQNLLNKYEGYRMLSWMTF